MVSGISSKDAYPMIRSAETILISVAFSTNLSGEVCPIWKNVMRTPRDTYVVTMGANRMKGYDKISREFDDYEQAKELYDYITSVIKYNKTYNFAKWKDVKIATIMEPGGSYSMREMLV